MQDFDDTLSSLTYENVEGSVDGTNQFEIIPSEQIYYVNDGSPRLRNAQQYIIIDQNNACWPLGQQVNFVTDLNFELDDEHRLIAQYAASLANSNSLNSIVESYDEYGNPVVHSITVDSHLNDPMNDAYLNEQLAECALAYENKNRELMMEILRLRDLSPSSDYNSLVNSVSHNLRSISRFSNSPVLSIKSQQDAVAVEELCYLRERKTELENHLQTLLMSKEELKNQLQNTIKMSENFQNLCSAPSSTNSTLNKKEAFAFKKDLNSLEEEAIRREKEFKETEELLKDELYQKSIQSYQEELDEEISKVQKEQKLLEEKELLEDFDRIMKVEEVANRLIQDKQTSQLNQLNLSNNNDETTTSTSEDSVTLHDDQPDQQLNLYNQVNESVNRTLPYVPASPEQPRSNGDQFSANEQAAIINTSGTIDDRKESYKIRSNETDLNEETVSVL